MAKAKKKATPKKHGEHDEPGLTVNASPGNIVISSIFIERGNGKEKVRILEQIKTEKYRTKRRVFEILTLKAKNNKKLIFEIFEVKNGEKFYIHQLRGHELKIEKPYAKAEQYDGYNKAIATIKDSIVTYTLASVP